MKYLFIYFFIIISAFGCNNDYRFVEFNQPDKYLKIKQSIRTIQDVEQIIYSVNPSTKSSDINIHPLIAKDISWNSITSNPNDTLLYIVEGGDKPVIISANVHCYPIIAMFDSPNISIIHELANPSESNSDLLAIIEHAIIYNQTADDFGVYCNTKSPRSIKEELKPKVPVEWDQGYPFNKYVPNHCWAGCVALAVAQSFIVTRHVDSFNVSLNYSDLIKVKIYTDSIKFPSVTNTIARFIFEIAKAVNTKFSKEGSSGKASLAIDLFTKRGNRMLVDKNPSNIRKTLRDYRNGIVLIVSRTEKSIGKILKGEAHMYIVDGYRIYSDGTDLIHINFGCGPDRYNGYFLTKLTAPNFTPDSPIKYPYEWDFYCLYK